MNIFKKLGTLTAGIVLATAFLANTAFAANYTVQSKDTLYSIGQLFRTSSSTIRSDNGLSGNMVYPGQVLYVRAGTYTVKSGDTLYLIAKKLGVSLDLLRKANNKWNNTIYPGQKLAIPASANSSAAAFSQAPINYTQAEVDLLARLVRAEADGEPYAAKVGVAAVVVNRVKSDLFPNSITSVIYEKDGGYYQFTPVENGWINKPATDTDRQAALDALKGSDPTHGALYYFDDSATNKWLWSKPILARIGHMVYVY
ncbi:MAG TPA: LysM peptidoglycan-binding domain-containing protein [Clostridia bacterium]|nr:LysM peptidoglycan-binding domain-containing protein [Clostridia bacterium]